MVLVFLFFSFRNLGHHIYNVPLSELLFRLLVGSKWQLGAMVKSLMS